MFQGQYYEQVEGAAMGSPLSPIVANIFMENFETKALERAPHPPSLWKRFVDDTFVILETEHKEEFFNHINSIEEKIKFTAENTKADGSIPFLDTLVTPKSEGSLSTTVYRKPTHTNQYLLWDSHHAIANKYSVINSPYNKGLSESFKNIFKKYGIQVHFTSGKTLKDELVAPKVKDHITKKSGIIYRFKCDRLECDEEYIGETSRTFRERFKEHLKAPSPIHNHSNTTGHTTSLENFSIVGREEQNLSRLIKESMFIRANIPSLNKNIGKYHLPIYGMRLLLTTKN